MHTNTHGLIPNQVIEVNGNIVELFLGRITDPDMNKDSEEFKKIINQTAYRTIMQIEVKHPSLATLESGIQRAEILNSRNNFIRKALNHNDGREVVEHTDASFMATFTTITNSVAIADRGPRGRCAPRPGRSPVPRRTTKSRIFPMPRIRTHMNETASRHLQREIPFASESS